MTNVHIMISNIYSSNFIHDVNSKYPLEDNKFIVFTLESHVNTDDIVNYPNVILHHYNSVKIQANNFHKSIRPFIAFIKNILSTIKILHDVVPSLYSAKKILIHGYFLEYFSYVFISNPWLLKKTRWIIWSGDVYRSFFDNLYGRLEKKMRYYVLRNMKQYIGIYGDTLEAKEEYNSNADLYEALYNPAINPSYFNKCPITPKLDNKIIIQIGNSAYSSSLHLDAFKDLAKFKDENIEIRCPLSYGGPQEYIDEVIKVGTEIFGSKFYPMAEFLNKDDYAKHMVSVDIFVGYYDKQQAFSNYLGFLYLKKKVFMKPHITTWDLLVNRLDLDIYDTLTIKDLDFSEFIAQSQEKKDHSFDQLSKTLFSEEYIASLWEPILKD